MSSSKESTRLNREKPGAQESFLKSSAEIQAEIRKLSNLCEDAYVKAPKEPLHKLKEERTWKDINVLLLKHGFAGFGNQVPSISVLSDTLLLVLTELSQVKNIIIDLERHVNELRILQENTSRKRSSSVSSSSDTGDSTSIAKIRILDEVKNILSADSYENIVSDLKQIKKVIVTLPNIEKFINSVCCELIPDLKTPDYLEKALNKFKRLCKAQKEFDFVIQENIELKKIVDYFCRLFDVQGLENAIEAIDCVFFFVHEMKEFLDVSPM
jgi:hypothetical protein